MKRRRKNTKIRRKIKKCRQNRPFTVLRMYDNIDVKCFTKLRYSITLTPGVNVIQLRKPIFHKKQLHFIKESNFVIRKNALAFYKILVCECL